MTDGGEEAAGLDSIGLHRQMCDEEVVEPGVGAQRGRAWRLGRHHESPA